MLSHITISPTRFESSAAAAEAAASFNRRLLRLLRKLLRDPDKRLTPATRHIGQLLLDMANAAAGCSWPSYRWFERLYGYSATTISKAIRVLARLNYLRVERRRHQSSRYHPNLALGDVAPRQTAPKPMPSRSQCQTPESEVSGTPESGVKRPYKDKPYCLTPDSSCDTAPDKASAPAAEPQKGPPATRESGGGDTEPQRPDPSQRNLLLSFRGGKFLSTVEVKRRCDRLMQKAMDSQDASTVELLMAHWPSLEPSLEAAVRGGGRDTGILQNVIWPTLRRSSATISA